MVEMRLDDAAGVRAYLGRFSGKQGRVLFRGQCGHYTAPDGTVSLISSWPARLRSASDAKLDALRIRYPPLSLTSRKSWRSPTRVGPARLNEVSGRP